jgi:hypothetical protein
MHKIIFPKTCEANKIIAKDKIFKYSKANERARKIFANDVERIRISHELVADKLNLPKSKSVPRILIIQIRLKTDKLSKVILDKIEKVSNIPIIFEIISDRDTYYTAAYRRRSESDKTKWVLSNYISSDTFNAETAEGTPLPMVLTMDSLYEQLLRSIMPIRKFTELTLNQAFSKHAKVEKLEKDALRLEKKVQNKKLQFNRRTEFNRELNLIKKELDGFKS